VFRINFLQYFIFGAYVNFSDLNSMCNFLRENIMIMHEPMSRFTAWFLVV